LFGAHLADLIISFELIVFCLVHILSSEKDEDFEVISCQMDLPPLLSSSENLGRSAKICREALQFIDKPGHL